MKRFSHALILGTGIAFSLGLPSVGCTGEQSLGERDGGVMVSEEAASGDATSLTNTPCVETCLRFGPSTCTRRCVQACVENASCVGDLVGRTISMMQCPPNIDGVVTLYGDGVDMTNYFEQVNALKGVRCVATKEYSGALPDGGWNKGKRVFVTKQAVGGDIRSVGGKSTGLESADAICASEAAAAGLDGRWVAWLSDSKTSADSRLIGEGPWLSADRTTVIFRSRASFQAGPQVPIGRAIDLSIWTGSTSAGQAAPVPGSSYCNAWSSTTGRAVVGFGREATWSKASDADCFSRHTLICFEQQ
jgi:hypothetical protein